MARNDQRFQELVENWLQRFDNVEEPERLLAAAGVAVSKVKCVSEAAGAPQVQARGLLAEIDAPRLGPIQVMNSPLKFSEIASQVRGPAPRLGEHNREILRRLIGYGAQQIAELEAQGVLYCEAP